MPSSSSQLIPSSLRTGFARRTSSFTPSPAPLAASLPARNHLMRQTSVAYVHDRARRAVRPMRSSQSPASPATTLRTAIAMNSWSAMLAQLKMVAPPGFEPGSRGPEPRMMDLYTTGLQPRHACDGDLPFVLFFPERLTFNSCKSWRSGLRRRICYSVLSALSCARA